MILDRGTCPRLEAFRRNEPVRGGRSFTHAHMCAWHTAKLCVWCVLYATTRLKMLTSMKQHPAQVVLQLLWVQASFSDSCQFSNARMHTGQVRAPRQRRRRGTQAAVGAAHHRQRHCQAVSALVQRLITLCARLLFPGPLGK